MISFRYHVFTVVAIFLSVALGIAVGNAYVQPALVDQLKEQTLRLQRDLDEARADLAGERARLDRLEQATDVVPLLVDGNLLGQRVVVVTHVGVDEASLVQVRRALDAAGADLVTGLALTEQMAAREPQDRAELANLLGMSVGDDPAPLIERAVAALADRLATGPPRRGAQPSGDDVLNGLLRGGFLALPDGSPALSEADLDEFGGNGEVVVVVAGGEEEPLPTTEEFLIPFVAELRTRGAAVAAVESAGTTYPFVPVLRGDAEVAGQIVTVDDVDLSIGAAALVLGLERLLAIGQGGDFGFKGSDVTPIPPP